MRRIALWILGMDGRGCWRDHVFVERLCNTIKYQHVYLRAYETISEAKTKLRNEIDYYQHRRPRSSLDRQTPDAVYFRSQPLKLAA